jgi:cysteine desulfurase family protein (TIGR01976 family)
MTSAPYPIERVRQRFPALQRAHRGRPVAYFDGPGGSQVVDTCIEAMADYMRKGGANLHGQFPSSVETEAHIHEARAAMADLLNTEAREIAFGANATTLLFHLARALARTWRSGDEIVVTELDHRGNVDPWIVAARDKGVVVRFLEVDTATLTLDLSSIDSIVNERTVLVAMGLASNAVGTVSEVARVAARAHEVHAVVAVDAVQAVPHFAVDFRGLGADVLTCSAYKFFGPHLGIVAIRHQLFERLEVDRLLPAPEHIPDKLETGTLNHEGIAGIKPAVEFIAWLGDGSTRRERIVSGYERMEAHENRLAEEIRAALSRWPGVRLYEAPPTVRKTPTVALTVEGMTPAEVARRVIEHGSVFVADGNFYASTLAERLGLNHAGGWVRAGLAPYNSDEEVARFVAAMRSLSH